MWLNPRVKIKYMGGAQWLPFSYEKPFDTVLCAQLMQRLESLGSPTDMQWGIYALYKSVCQR